MSRRMARCSDCDSPLEVQVATATATFTPPTDRPESRPRHTEPVTFQFKRGESDGKVYCSNPSCFYWTTAHPMGSEINEGPVGA